MLFEQTWYDHILPNHAQLRDKVVVEFQPDQEGVVVTAFPTFSIRGGEVKRWP